jgi:RNA polymerase sigma factor (sigma-70 family)|nr:sigma-70 family RNA polymerase sigma factor [Kofleriaceae bacterium]
MDAERVAAELTGLLRLARSLARGGDAEDLLQDAAVDAIARGGGSDDELPLRPWLAAVLRNRWRMTRRSASRRAARELASEVGDAVATPEESIDRARALSRLAEALVTLDEPFRSTVIARYFDGESSADIAARAGVPAATVRSRLKTGLDRLRAQLEPTTLRAITPAALMMRGAVMTTKSKLAAVAVVVIAALVGGGYAVMHGGGSAPAVATGSDRSAKIELPAPAPPRAPRSAIVPPPSQARATVGPSDAAGGIVRGRVIDWSRGGGVDGADLTFASPAGALTARSGSDGSFELQPDRPGELVLVAAGKPGYLPYAPEYGTSPVRLHLAAHREVDGVTVFLYPALDYHGTVVDAQGKPVAGAKVVLLDTPYGEQVIDKLQTEWTTDGSGSFVFHAADDAVLEATRGAQRGRARLDGNVAVSHRMTIKLGDLAPRDQAITGVVVDGSGAPVADALVRGLPDDDESGRYGGSTVQARASVFAQSGADGTFALPGVDRGNYLVTATTDDFAPDTVVPAKGGAKNVRIVLDAGAELAGTVTTSDHQIVPTFSLLVFRKLGAGRGLVLARTVVDANGRFSVRVRPGDYELIASAAGWAPSQPTTAHPGDAIALVVTPGATLHGTVVSALDKHPLEYARVTREARGGGASAAPANAGVVTDGDGSFVLTGIPPGPVSVTVGAGNFDPKIVSIGMAGDGDDLGPVTIEMSPIAPGADPKIEVIGIGLGLASDGDALAITRVIDGGGAQAAGIVLTDRLVSVDGASVVELGLDGAIAKIRGVEGTVVAIGVKHKDQDDVVVYQVTRRKLRA